MLSVFRLVIVYDFNLLPGREKPCLLDRIFVFGPRTPLLRPTSWEVNPDKLLGLLVYYIYTYTHKHIYWQSCRYSTSPCTAKTTAFSFKVFIRLLRQTNKSETNCPDYIDVIDCTSTQIKKIIIKKSRYKIKHLSVVFSIRTDSSSVVDYELHYVCANGRNRTFSIVSCKHFEIE